MYLFIHIVIYTYTPIKNSKCKYNWCTDERILWLEYEKVYRSSIVQEDA